MEANQQEKRPRPAVIEDLWSLVGGFGRYSVFLFAFMCYVTIVVSFQQFVPTYYGSAPNYQCIPNDPNMTSSCRINQCGCLNCTYVFDDEFTSAVSEWNLICDRAHLRAMTQSVYMTGLLVGSIGFGKFSDHFGRKPAAFLSIFLMIAFGLGSAFANGLILFSVMRFGSGVATAGSLLIRFVYSIELSTFSLRTAIGAISNLFIMIGALILTLMAYLIRDWRHLMLAVALPGAPLLVLWKWIPESVSWLIAKGRLDEAQRVLEIFASASGVKVDSERLASVIKDVKMAEEHASTEKSKAGILDLIKTPKMRKRMIILILNWFVNSVVFYGITLNAKNLGGSFHLNVFILFAVGIPAVFTLWVVFKKCGRRIGYSTLMLLGGLICLMVLTVPKTTGESPVIKVLAVFGVFCASATFSGIYIYTSELSPTLLRNVSVGVGSMIARAGGIVAPYIVFLNDFLQNLPLIVFGGMAFTAGVAALFLPETLFSPMPQTVEQVESWAEDYGVPCRKKKPLKTEEFMLNEGEVQKVEELAVNDHEGKVEKAEDEPYLADKLSNP